MPSSSARRAQRGHRPQVGVGPAEHEHGRPQDQIDHRSPPQAVAGGGIEQVHGVAVGGDGRAGIVGSRGGNSDDKRRLARRAMKKAGGAQLLDEVLRERHLAFGARAEAQQTPAGCRPRPRGRRPPRTRPPQSRCARRRSRRRPAPRSAPAGGSSPARRESPQRTSRPARDRPRPVSRSARYCRRSSPRACRRGSSPRPDRG